MTPRPTAPPEGPHPHEKEHAVSNPFDDESSRYHVVVNAEGQHSLWPAHLDVPAGWDAVHGVADRAACVAYIEENWTDMRPKSLVADR